MALNGLAAGDRLRRNWATKIVKPTFAFRFFSVCSQLRKNNYRVVSARAPGAPNRVVSASSERTPCHMFFQRHLKNRAPPFAMSLTGSPGLPSGPPLGNIPGSIPGCKGYPAVPSELAPDSPGVPSAGGRLPVNLLGFGFALRGLARLCRSADGFGGSLWL